MDVARGVGIVGGDPRGQLPDQRDREVAGRRDSARAPRGRTISARAAARIAVAAASRNDPERRFRPASAASTSSIAWTRVLARMRRSVDVVIRLADHPGLPCHTSKNTVSPAPAARCRSGSGRAAMPRAISVAARFCRHQREHGILGVRRLVLEIDAASTSRVRMPRASTLTTRCGACSGRPARARARA